MMGAAGVRGGWGKHDWGKLEKDGSRITATWRESERGEACLKETWNI